MGQSSTGFTIRYDIVIEISNTIQLVGVYDGRSLGAEFQRFAPMQRPFALYAALDKKTGKITVYRPPL
jgi:hypothetical protein